jgi:hypothetical protein
MVQGLVRAYYEGRVLATKFHEALYKPKELLSACIVHHNIQSTHTVYTYLTHTVHIHGFRERGARAGEG